MTRSTSFLTAVMLVLAWGVLAFGAVYPWAYIPLLITVPIVGAWGMWLANARERKGRADLYARPLAVALLFVALAMAVQLVPLPRGVLGVLSPALASLLSSLDLSFVARGDSPHPLSVNPGATLIALWFLICLTILLLGVAAALSQTGARRLVQAIVVLATVVAVIAIVQRATGTTRVYGFWTPIYGREPFGPFVNRNHFAGWMVMALSLALGFFGGKVEIAMRAVRPTWRDRVLWWSTSSAGQLIGLGCAMLVMALSIVLTLSRSGAASLALAVLVFAAFAWRRYRGAGGRIVYLAFLGLLVGGLIAFDSTEGVSGRFSKMDWFTSMGRLGAWSDTIRVTRDFWLTGTGLNTFSDVMLVYQRRPGPHLVHAHSDYLQLLAEGGLLVTVPVLVATAVFGREVRRRLAAPVDDPMTAWLRIGACTATAAIALQEAVEGSLQMPGNALLMIVVFAIMIHRSPAPERRGHFSERVRKQVYAE